MADAPVPPSAPPEVEPATERYAAQVGPESRSRPASQLARALGGVAALVGIFALGSLVDEIVTGDASKGVGFVAFAAYGAGGVAVVLKGGPSRRTAGVVALGVSIPVALGYVIFSDDGFSTSEPTTVLALSTVAWAALHLAGPARGHGLLLAAALTGAWATIVVQTGLDAVTALDPVSPFDGLFGVGSPDATTPAIVSLLFGTGYLAAGFGLHRTGLEGTATSFVGVGIVATALGVILAGAGRDDAVIAGLFLAAGALVGFIGSRTGRRLSTWLGAIGAVGGAAALVTRPFHDAVEAEAIVVLALAAALVLVLPVLAAALEETVAESDEPVEGT